MFPRPSRFLRLGVGVSCLSLFLFCFYFINNDHSDDHKILSDFPDSGYRMVRISQQRQVLDNERSLEDALRTIAERPLGVPSKTANASQSHGKFQRNVDPANTATEFELSVRKMLISAAKLDTKKVQKGPGVDEIGNSPKLVNPHNFSYIHNPASLCGRNPPRLLIYIHSSPVNLKKRQAVRQTWGHPKILSLYNASLVFILGQTTPIIQSLIDMEALQYADIVQESFHDTYRNLTHKGVAGLKWASNHCKSAQFLLKTDDDILLDIVSLLEHFYTNVIPSHGRTRLVLCNVWTRMKVLRDTKSKWYISKEEFPPDYFPAYCSGSAFFLSGDLVSPLYLTALTTPFFWVDDYYITGSLVNQLKVSHVRLNPVYLMDFNVVDERLRNDSKDLMVFHVKKLKKFISLWPRLVQRHPGMGAFLTDSVLNSAHELRLQQLKSRGSHDAENSPLTDTHRYESHQIVSTKTVSKNVGRKTNNQSVSEKNGSESKIPILSENSKTIGNSQIVSTNGGSVGNIQNSPESKNSTYVGNVQDPLVSKFGGLGDGSQSKIHESKWNLVNHAQLNTNLKQDTRKGHSGLLGLRLASTKSGISVFPMDVQPSHNSSFFLSQRVRALSKSIA